MAISFVADTISSWGSAAGTETFDKPSGATTDDVLVALQFLPTDNAITVPSGWTHEINHENNEVSQEHRYHLYWLRCGGSEPANYTTTWSGTFNTEIYCACFRGCVASGNPVRHKTSATSPGGGTNATAVSFTTTIDGCMLVYGLVNWNGGSFNPPTVPGTFTEPANGDGIVQGSSYFLQTTQGATGDVVGSCSLNGNKTVIMIALEPAAGGGGSVAKPNNLLLLGCG